MVRKRARKIKGLPREFYVAHVDDGISDMAFQGSPMTSKISKDIPEYPKISKDIIRARKIKGLPREFYIAHVDDDISDLAHVH